MVLRRIVSLLFTKVCVTAWKGLSTGKRIAGCPGAPRLHAVGVTQIYEDETPADSPGPEVVRSYFTVTGFALKPHTFRIDKDGYFIETSLAKKIRLKESLQVSIFAICMKATKD